MCNFVMTLSLYNFGNRNGLVCRLSDMTSENFSHTFSYNCFASVTFPVQYLTFAISILCNIRALTVGRWATRHKPHNPTFIFININITRPEPAWPRVDRGELLQLRWLVGTFGSFPSTSHFAPPVLSSER